MRMYFVMIETDDPEDPLTPLLKDTSDGEAVLSTFRSRVDAKTAAEMDRYAAEHGYHVCVVNR